MRLYEKYKRFKAGKYAGNIGKQTQELFNIDFTDEQMLAISYYDYKEVIKYTAIAIFCFMFGIIYGLGMCK